MKSLINELDYKFWIPLIVSAGALLFSFLNFQQAKKFENANHVFRLKIDVYTKLLAALNNLINEYQMNLIAARAYIKNIDEETVGKLNQTADVIDEITSSFDDLIINNALVISEKVLIELNKFSTRLLNTDPVVEDDESIENKLIRMESLINEFIEDANRIAMLFRKDLHVDSLNIHLYKRLK